MLNLNDKQIREAAEVLLPLASDKHARRGTHYFVLQRSGKFKIKKKPSKTDQVLFWTMDAKYDWALYSKQECFDFIKNEILSTHFKWYDSQLWERIHPDSRFFVNKDGDKVLDSQSGGPYIEDIKFVKDNCPQYWEVVKEYYLDIKPKADISAFYEGNGITYRSLKNDLEKVDYIVPLFHGHSCNEEEIITFIEESDNIFNFLGICLGYEIYEYKSDSYADYIARNPKSGHQFFFTNNFDDKGIWALYRYDNPYMSKNVNGKPLFTSILHYERYFDKITGNIYSLNEEYVNLLLETYVVMEKVRKGEIEKGNISKIGFKVDGKSPDGFCWGIWGRNEEDYQIGIIHSGIVRDSLGNEVARKIEGTYNGMDDFSLFKISGENQLYCFSDGYDAYLINNGKVISYVTREYISGELCVFSTFVEIGKLENNEQNIGKVEEAFAYIKGQS